MNRVSYKKLYLYKNRSDIRFTDNVKEATLYNTYKEAIKVRRDMFSDSLRFKVETYNKRETVKDI